MGLDCNMTKPCKDWKLGQRSRDKSINNLCTAMRCSHAFTLALRITGHHLSPWSADKDDVAAVEMLSSPRGSQRRSVEIQELCEGALRIWHH